MLDYFLHNPEHKNKLKLSMVILVKNEEDIIEKNIKFHFKIGIDNFVIIDNGSTDNTYEILQNLQKIVDIYHYPIRNFYQFKKNIENRVKLLKRGAKMGNHIKRWAKLYLEGKLEEEFYNNLLVSQKNLKCLEEMKIIKEDSLMIDYFKGL